MESRLPLRAFWQKREDGGAKLLRLYGMSPQVYVPPRLAGRPLLEIAPYCFAAKRPAGQEAAEETVIGKPGEGAVLGELSAEYIEEIQLPDSVETIGGYAFYNCKRLRTLSVGAGVKNIGSDAFMNALSLHTLLLRCGADEASGVRQMLAQISWDVEVRFVPETKTEASLLYPEYYESYDEVAPAHLFGRKLSGEGFRARQCIRDGRVDFAGYDAVFPRACVREREETLSRMALLRVRYPYGLSDRSRGLYRGYIKEHIGEILERMTRQRDWDGLTFLRREDLICRGALLRGVEIAAEEDWAEGAAGMLGWLAEGGDVREKRYDFGD